MTSLRPGNFCKTYDGIAKDSNFINFFLFFLQEGDRTRLKYCLKGSCDIFVNVEKMLLNGASLPNLRKGSEGIC